MSSPPRDRLAADRSAARIIERLGLPDLRRHPPLIVALAVDAVGSGTSGPLLLLYLTRVIGLGLGSAGLLMTVAAVGSLVVPALVGRLTGTLGARRIVIGAQILQGIAMLGLLTAREVPLIAIATAAAAVGQRAFWSSVFSLVAAAAADEPDDSGHDRWFAASGMIQNAGFALGGLAAGALLLLDGQAPFVVALAVNAVSFLLSAALFGAERGVRAERGSRDPADARSGVRVWTDRRYLTLILANTLYAFCSVLLGIGLPLYAVQILKAPPWVIGPLLALVTVLGATCQGIGVRLTRRLRRATVLALAGVIWTVWGVFTAGLPLLHAGWLIGGLFGCVLLFAVAELLHAPASMALATAQAPATQRESYLSWFQYSFAIASIGTPSAFGLLTDRWPALPWLAAAAAAVVAIGLTQIAVHRRGSRRIGDS